MRQLRFVVACVLALSLLSGASTLIAQQRPEEIKGTSGKDAVVDRPYAVVQGAWSAATVSLFNTSSDTWSALLEGNPNRHVFLYAPDHKKRIEVVGERVWILVGGRRFAVDIDGSTKHDAELGWAPDSGKFFVTWSESGELGPWHMQVYGVDDQGAHEYRGVEHVARREFEERVRHWPTDPSLNTPELRSIWDSDQYCEPYHVIGGRWLNGSREILLSVLIRNTSDCRYMSEFNVYRVDSVTGRILQRYSAVEGHKRFGDKYLPIITR